MPLTDTELRNTLRAHTGRFGSPIALLHQTGEITEHTHGDLLKRAHDLDLDGRDHEADQLRDAAEYVLDAGCRPAVEGWAARP
ncbi:hypothetical protein [Streptomyces sp. IBSBF 2507]|uniref:hypothetical protein n=1 Tax=Streptomyces sp. IBSBF 2507 TaxID=2903530 RepID=UPI00351DB8F8